MNADCEGEAEARKRAKDNLRRIREIRTRRETLGTFQWRDGAVWLSGIESRIGDYLQDAGPSVEPNPVTVLQIEPLLSATNKPAK